MLVGRGGEKASTHALAPWVLATWTLDALGIGAKNRTR